MEDTVDEPVTEGLLPHRLGRAGARRDGHRDAEAHDARDVLGARPPALLLAATCLDRRDTRALPHVERADALRAVELVRVQREQIHGDLAHVELERADALHSVAVERDAAVAADAADVGDRLERPDLVVACMAETIAVVSSI